MSMEDVKTEEKLADEILNEEDAVSTENEIEGTEPAAEETAVETGQNEEQRAIPLRKASLVRKKISLIQRMKKSRN